MSKQELDDRIGIDSLLAEVLQTRTIRPTECPENLPLPAGPCELLSRRISKGMTLVED